ncbi:MAG: UDP-N-acetylglucosamine--N-acetylmuramyl-(pentapeptide) pyrophosphoryl-undecaprenol N-acetylglucosamine transferase [Sedimentisphaerales bacterium]|nr:UDP-N-acetylglucosamine--N-acetylmuramyl-(pentapeptide) pyrophosphoryl-undecaprenol N-acetylglucosamine transferase [Sedimentisphaerales bacterium]
MSKVSFFFAGGGTGGHIYPALAVVEQILRQEPDAGIHFFHSTRPVDEHILGKTKFARTPLPAIGLSAHPVKLLRFCSTFRRSYLLARSILADHPNPVVIGAGGFVAAPVCLAGRRMGVPVALLNVDLAPGRANRLAGRWADEIFVQFAEGRDHFHRSRATIHVVGCPLRSGFVHPQPEAAIRDLGLDPDKKVLLITGASSGSQSINEAVCRLLDQLAGFADSWQIVHLTGLENYESVLNRYKDARITHKVVNYYEGMPDLLAAADLVIGRSGAVGVAEYAAAGVPSICMPYPHHKDMHQYLNAGKLVEAGAAIIVDDLPDVQNRTEWLWEELESLMKDDAARQEMSKACKRVARPHAAETIASRLLELAGG